MQTLTPEQLHSAAAAHQVDTAALQAVLEVESGGSGFLADGRCKILFERHIFWQRLQTPDRGIDPRPLARAHPELCGPSWNPTQYPYGTEVEQWAKVNTIIFWAQRNDSAHWESYKKAAYEACSWGLFQLLGEHYPELGYADVYAFVHDQEAGELNQLNTMLAWTNHNGLLPDLAAHNWLKFATGYNGPGQSTIYANKLMSAYARISQGG